jgi:hypothetical protein
VSNVQYLPLDVEAMLQARQFSESACLACVGLTELCPACQDLRDTRDAEIAHQIVDEGNLQYKYVWSIIRDHPSGHDWTDREDEFLEPIVQLADRLYDLETSVTMTSNEVICSDCHLAHNKHAVCPNCN